MLALGLLISTITKNQFVASQIALVVGFLPSFLLSGFVFEISSLPELIIKNLLAILRDKRSRLVLIVLPLIQMIVFSFAANLEVKNVSIGILDNDHGQASRELTQRFEGSETFRHITYLDDAEEIAPLVDSQQAILVVHIADGFSHDIEAGDQR
ncbi:MAG: ABC-2 type transport system permease protein [Pseudoalteromonas tetraodonis]|jgi:ABC-2 type transport system permease protein